MINDEADEVIKRLFDSLKNRFQSNFELMKASDFAFDFVHLLHYKCHKINLDRGGSYIDSLDWIKNKKATTYLINKKDNKCCQYAVTVVLNHEVIGKHAKRIKKIKPFIKNINGKQYIFHQKQVIGKNLTKIM